MTQSEAEFYFKLGQLFGVMDGFMERIEDETYNQADIDQIKNLIIDTKRKFYAFNGEVTKQ